MESHRQLTSNLPVVLNARMRSLKLELTPVAKIIWSLPAEKCSWRTSVRFSKEPSLTENRQLKNKRSLSVFSSDKPIQIVTPLSPSCYRKTSGHNTACRNARAGLGRSTGTNWPSRCSRWRIFFSFLMEENMKCGWHESTVMILKLRHSLRKNESSSAGVEEDFNKGKMTEKSLLWLGSGDLTCLL